MKTYERIEMLEEAQALIEDAIIKINQATRGTKLAARASAYLTSALATAIDEDSGWLGQNPANIGSLIDDLKADGIYVNRESDTDRGAMPAPPPYWVGNDWRDIVHLLPERPIDFVKAYRGVWNCDLFEAINTQKYLKAHST